AQRAEAGGEVVRIRQGMTAVAAVRLAGQIVMQMQVLRARDMSFRIGPRADAGVAQVEAAIEDAAGLVRMQGLRSDQRHLRQPRSRPGLLRRPSRRKRAARY